MKQAELMYNLIALTRILNDNYKCELQFRLNDEDIEILIKSIRTFNNYSFKVPYDFDVDAVLYDFKETVVKDTLKVDVEL